MRITNICLVINAVLAHTSSARPAVAVDGTSVRMLSRRDYNSNNWCGMVTNAAVNTVEATWTVPTVQAPGGSSQDEYEAYQWVGIDGSTSDCSTLLQAGTGQYIYPNGTIVTFFWYEFYPAPPTLLYTASSGDNVHVKVHATSDTQGTIYLDNLTTGQSVTYDLTSSQGSLCFQTVEWIQEDSLPKLFPPFATFDMTGCTAAAVDGSSIDASNSTPWYLTKDGQTECHAELQSGSDIRFFNN